MKLISIFVVCGLMFGCAITKKVTKAGELRENSVYLADLSPTITTNFYAICKDQIGIKQDAKGKIISVKDVVYENGIMLHAPAKGVGELVYELNGEYKLLDAVLLGARDKGSVIFKIYADGEEIYVSPVITYDAEPTEISLNVTGVNELKITLDKEKSNACDLVVIGDPVLYE